MLRSLTALAPDSLLLKQIQDKGLETLLLPYLNDWRKALQLQGENPQALHKIRLIYDAHRIERVEVLAYSPLAIQELWLYDVGADFSYEHKFLERTCLNPFPNIEREQPKIPLFVREGLLTDTSFTNIVLRFGDELLTPNRPLLRGVMREHLLRKGIIREAELGVEALENCDEVLLINAMLPLERAIRIKLIRS